MSKAAKSVIVPWKIPCKLRQEIRDRELGEADFAVDLNKVIFGVPGGTAALLLRPGAVFRDELRHGEPARFLPRSAPAARGRERR